MYHILHVRTPRIQCFGKTVRYPTNKTSFVNSDVDFFFQNWKKKQKEQQISLFEFGHNQN